MLRTRLWMGAVLIALTAFALVVDQWLAPWFPLLFVLVTGLALASTFELLRLLPTTGRPAGWLCVAGIAVLMAANWLPNLGLLSDRLNAWQLIAGVFAALLVLAFLAEMARFREPGHAVPRLALTVWLFAYLGLLPSFLIQLRWLKPGEWENGTAALALAVFVPKCCDIGAYCTGRLVGRHQMTPVLSPKKTWEGALGGLAAAVLMTVVLDRFGPAELLRKNLALEVGFGLSVGVAGMLGDLAESLIKRDCQHKDAAHTIPGFGGVLDVVDAILFAAPVSYFWLQLLSGPLAP